jgi:hypothetical protein
MNGLKCYFYSRGRHPPTLTTVSETVKKNILGFRDNNISSDIQQYVSNNHVYDKLSDNKDSKNLNIYSNFPGATLQALW